MIEVNNLRSNAGIRAFRGQVTGRGTADARTLAVNGRRTRVVIVPMKTSAVIWLSLLLHFASVNLRGANADELSPAVSADVGDGVEEAFFTAYPDLRDEREVVSQAARALAAEGNQSQDWRLAAEMLANRTRALIAQRTPAEWQQKAVKLYPELGVAGSKFNTLFLQHYRELQTTSPNFTEEPSWPVLLAARCSDELRGKRKPTASVPSAPSPNAPAQSPPAVPRPRAGFWSSSINFVLLAAALTLPGLFLFRKSRATGPGDSEQSALSRPWRLALKPTGYAYSVTAAVAMIRTFIVNADQSFIDRFGITLLVSAILGLLAALPTFGCATVFYSFQQYRGATAGGGRAVDRAATAKTGG